MNVSAEVIDLRSLVPLDLETVVRLRPENRPVRGGQPGHPHRQLHRRNRLHHPGRRFDYLDAPVKRVGAKNGIAPQSHILEAAFLPNVNDDSRRRQLAIL
jgi:pyruvate/2-oxoglutarate/acetoin dehydrogenase E1 component